MSPSLSLLAFPIKSFIVVNHDDKVIQCELCGTITNEKFEIDGKQLCRMCIQKADTAEIDVEDPNK